MLYSSSMDKNTEKILLGLRYLEIIGKKLPNNRAAPISATCRKRNTDTVVLAYFTMQIKKNDKTSNSLLITSAKQTNSFGSVIWLVLDHFKSVNYPKPKVPRLVVLVTINFLFPSLIFCRDSSC